MEAQNDCCNYVLKSLSKDTVKQFIFIPPAFMPRGI